MALDKLTATSEKGVFYRTESGRKNGVKLDRQFVIVYKLGGKKYRGAIGWESDKHRVSEAADKIKQFRENFKNGTGPLSLEEERTVAQHQRKSREDAHRQREAKDTQRNKTVADLVTKYNTFSLGKKSYASIRGHLDRIRDDLGCIHLRELTLEQVEGWQATMKKRPRLARKQKTEGAVSPQKMKGVNLEKAPEPLPPLSALTVNRHLQTLKAMMTKACDWGWITERRLREIRKVKLDTEKDRRRLDFLSREEADQLINSADEVIRPVVICALQTGMRKGEILGLKWRHVDLTHRVIHLPKTKSGEPRSIPINDKLLDTLKDKKLIRSLTDDHVFLNPDTKTRWSDLKRQFNRAVTKAKLAHKDIVFHHLRHTAASWMVMAGVPLLTVARVLGHADTQMVARYSHLSPEHMDKAVASLDGSLLVQNAANPEQQGAQTQPANG